MPGRRRNRPQAVHVSQLAVQRDFIFRVVAGFQFFDQAIDLLVRAGRQIDEPAMQVLVFGHCDAAEPPQRRLRKVERACPVLDPLRRPGDKPDAAGTEALGGRKRLEQLQSADTAWHGRRHQRSAGHRFSALSIQTPEIYDTYELLRFFADLLDHVTHVLGISGSDGKSTVGAASETRAGHYLDGIISALPKPDGKLRSHARSTSDALIRKEEPRFRLFGSLWHHGRQAG